MAFLTIGGVPVPCALGTPEQREPQLVGDRLTTFSGRTRVSLRGWVRSWSLTTPPLPLSDAQGLVLALQSPYPLVCSGDVFGGVETECIATVNAVRHQKYADGERAVVEFTLTDARAYNPFLFWLAASRGLPADASFSRPSEATYIDR